LYDRDKEPTIKGHKPEDMTVQFNLKSSTEEFYRKQGENPVPLATFTYEGLCENIRHHTKRLKLSGLNPDEDADLYYKNRILRKMRARFEPHLH